MARNFSADTDRINFGSSVPDLTANWTISTWIRRTSVNRATAITPIWSRWTSSAAERQLYVYFLSATSEADVDKIQVDVPFVAAILTGTTAVSDTNWHHIAVTRSDDSWILYLDGANDGQATNAAVQETGGELTLGDTIVTGTGAGDLLGDQCEVAGWEQALGSAEVVSLAKTLSPFLVRTPSLVFYAPVIGRASPEPDYMGGNNGVLTGTANAIHTRMSYPGSRQAISTKGSSQNGGTILFGSLLANTTGRL